MALDPDEHAGPAGEWRAGYDRVCELIAASTPEAMTISVPACPAWSVHDLLSHVVGLGHDVLAGAEPEDHDPAWTQSHVDDRAEMTASQVLAEWAVDADRIEQYVGQTDPRPLNDLLIHEQDLRGALGVPGARDTGGLHRVRDVMLGRLGEAVGDLAPLRLESDGWTWSSAAGEPAAVLRAPAYDVIRALTSRRTADQLRTWTVTGDITPYLDAFAALGDLPSRPLAE